jgi:serine/threonine protein kinase
MYDAKTDMWSMGILGYEMMALELPFNAQNMPQLIARIIKKVPHTPFSTSRFVDCNCDGDGNGD